jgi:uncharacterized protein (TIGR02453 family)
MAVNTQTFSGFTPEAIQFLADLAQHNERSWFQPRKSDYERLLKEPLERMVAALAERLAARDIPLRADPRHSPFRIYRDTRFSRDKSPYKAHLGASFPWTGAAAGPADPTADHPHGNGGYFNFAPGEMFVGGGMWMPDRSRMEAFRRAIVDDPDRVSGAIRDAAFVAWFGDVHPHETLKRIPSGYPADHPMADMFRWKDVVFGRRLSDTEVCSPGLPDTIADGYAAAIPVFRFLATLG